MYLLTYLLQGSISVFTVLMGTSFQWSVVRGDIIKKELVLFSFDKAPRNSFIQEKISTPKKTTLVPTEKLFLNPARTKLFSTRIEE